VELVVLCFIPVLLWQKGAGEVPVVVDASDLLLLYRNLKRLSNLLPELLEGEILLNHNLLCR
jgi:hypothetical protein